MDEATPYQETVAAGVRARREALGRSQDEIARAMRQFGLTTWTRSVVATVERGARMVDPPELAVLLDVLEVDGLTELLRLRGGRVALAPGYNVPAEAIADAIAGATRIREVMTLDPPAMTARGKQQVRGAFDHARKTLARWSREAERVWPGAPFQEVQAAHDAAAGQAEEKAAAALGESAFSVSLLSRRLWGRSLTDERDARTDAKLPAGTSTRSVQALRGHVTRGLLQELRANLPVKKGVRRG